MTVYHQVKQSTESAKADVFSYSIKIWWVSKRTAEGQKPEWEPAQPIAITVPQYAL